MVTGSRRCILLIRLTGIGGSASFPGWLRTRDPAPISILPLVRESDMGGVTALSTKFYLPT